MALGSYQFFYFSELIKRPICVGKIKDRIGQLTDLVFLLTEPYPEAVGIYIEHGWAKPTAVCPMGTVLRIDEDAIFVQPPRTERPILPLSISLAGSWPINI